MGTTNFDLEKKLKNTPKFHGVFSLDTVPKKLEEGGYIYNVRKEADNRMGHWQAFYIFPNGEPRVFFFDPFSFPPPSQIEKILQTNFDKGEILCNPFVDESRKGVNCGELCVTFVKECVKSEKHAYDYLQSHQVQF